MKRLLFALVVVSAVTAWSAGSVDPATFGLDPAAEPAVNAAALQKALDGGRKTVTVTKPGVYRLDRTVFLDDDTTLTFAKGVVLSKATVYANVLANRGAFFGGRNRNIVIRGANVATNGKEAVPPVGSRACGLRGLLGFYDIENLELRDTVINDFGTSQYAVQVVGFDGLLIDGFELRGNKDGIHLNCGKNFVIRNGKLRTYDDGIAINAGEWPGGCTPLMGSITDGLIENVEDEPGGHCNFARVITGAWMEWHKGMPLQFRDIFTIGNDVYSVYPGKVSTNETVSLTPPSHKSGVWTSPEGINFFHCQSDGCRRADIRRVIFRNIRMNCARAISCSWEMGSWARLVHPELPRKDYPVIDIRLENVVKTAPGVIVTGNADADIVFEKCRAEKGVLASMGWPKQYRTQCPVRRITVDGVSRSYTNGVAYVTSPSATGVRSYRDPQPGWPPRPLNELNGRKLEFFAHGALPEWGYGKDPREDFFAVVHSRTAQTGAPLVVVLHSSGHHLMTCLRCVRQVGNHDIYVTPEDMFGLYVDCSYNAGTDWWWGHSNPASKTFAESPLEKRILSTVEWTLKTYGLDRNRVYLCGNSMGASGTLGIGLRHGDVFAAIKANVPAGVEHACSRIGIAPETVPADANLPDPPICIDYSSQTDKWSLNHERLIRGLHDRKWPYLLFWGAFGHVNDNSALAKFNDIVHDFDWLSVRKDEPYPVFTDATCDGVPPWPIKVTDGKKTDATDLRPGQLNGFFRWRTVSQSQTSVEMDLYLANPQTKFPELRAPESATACVTLRRLTLFKPEKGTPVRWSFGDRSGELTADPLVSIPGLELTREPKRLTLAVR